MRAHFLAVTFLTLSTLLPAQQTQPALQRRTAGANDAPVLRTGTRLVVVDVTVTDSRHHPVHGLARQDFTLDEDRKPQTLSAFEEHTAPPPDAAVNFAALPPMPPGVFTNYTPTPSNAPVNILLLDTLNTPLKDQAYVRSQVLDYIRKAKPGASIAIFSLTTGLHLLQGFTSSPEVLRAVVDKSRGTASPVLDDPAGTGAQESVSEQITELGTPSSSQVAAGMAGMEAAQQAFQLQVRAQYTLDAMNNMARYLANLPGRKNLIWFSGSFPLDILPDGDAENPFQNVANAEEEYRETTNLLARSQVAVYPIDARGLMTAPMMDASQSGRKYARNPAAMGKDLSKFNQSQFLEHDTMSRMAEDTGGQAFFNTNGLADAVAKSIENGANYYTLAYTPTNPNWKGDFRKIEVKLAQAGYTLSYRRGYYADDPNSPRSIFAQGPPKARTGTTAAASTAPTPVMLNAMIHGLPGSGQILFKVRVLPATGSDEAKVVDGNLTGAPNFARAGAPFRRYLVDYAIDPANIRFTLGTDGNYHANVEFVAIVYDPEGHAAVVASNEVHANLTAARYASLARGGLPFHQEISVPAKGAYTLRTGVHDVGSDRVGTTELNVAWVKNLPPPPDAAPTTPAPVR